jgi:hypothetical protein
MDQSFVKQMHKSQCGLRRLADLDEEGRRREERGERRGDYNGIKWLKNVGLVGLVDWGRGATDGWRIQLVGLEDRRKDKGEGEAKGWGRWIAQFCRSKWTTILNGLSGGEWKPNDRMKEGLDGR